MPVSKKRKKATSSNKKRRQEHEARANTAKIQSLIAMLAELDKYEEQQNA